MEHAKLAALFRRIVVAGAPILSASCSSRISSCPSDQEQTVAVTVMATDAATEDGGIDELVARCQTAPPDCTPLCEHTISMNPGAYVLEQCQLITSNNGLSVHVVYMPKCTGGRCPEGLVAPVPAARGNPLGAWLADCAHLENASVDAFEILAGELRAHRAPRRLIAAARAAAWDERRHAAVMGRLAARHGSVPPPVRIARRPTRDLQSVARDNAAEGCGRETYAALIAARQARAAADPAIRAAMAGIARDETRHAALSWAVDAWASERLAPAARRRVRAARHEAMERLLLGSPETTMTAPLRAQAGLPDPDEAARMMTALRAQLPA